MRNVRFVKVQKLLQNYKLLMKQYAVGCFDGKFSLVIETKAPYDGAHGSVAERFNAPVLKTDEGLYPSVSSNLTASAKF